MEGDHLVPRRTHTKAFFLRTGSQLELFPNGTALPPETKCKILQPFICTTVRVARTSEVSWCQGPHGLAETERVWHEAPHVGRDSSHIMIAAC